MKSVNVFKNDPSNKITISNGGVPCGEFEIEGYENYWATIF